MKSTVSLTTGKTGTIPSAAKGGDHPDRTAAVASMSAEQLQQMIAEEAYLRAERRGFQDGNPTSDWLAAEEEITRRLTRNLERHAKV